MRVLFLADDQLLPTRDGGAAANLNDIVALERAGAEVIPIIHSLRRLSLDDRDRHSDRLPAALFLTQRGRASATLRHPLWPTTVSRHAPTAVQLQELLGQHLVRAHVDVIVAAHEYTLPLAHRVGRALGRPVVLRSHNDEIHYFRSLLSAADTIHERLFYGAEWARLQLSWAWLVQHVTAVALISEADAKRYRAAGLQTHLVAPTLSQAPRTSTVIPPFDARRPRLVFAGALGVPNTAQGVLWFARNVLPLVQAACPGAELDVFGRGSSDELRAQLGAVPGVVIHGEVDRLEPAFDRARVFVNPIFHGSGINMKMGPPAAAGLPIVATPMGIRGLEALRPVVAVEADPAGLAAACSRLLLRPDRWQTASIEVNEAIVRHYSPAATAAAWGATISAVQSSERS